MSDTYTNNRTGEQFEEDWQNNDGKRMIKPIPKEPKRWRADPQEEYFYLDNFFDPILTTDTYSEADFTLYNIFNYFQTEHQAQLAADAIRELLKVIHTQGTILGYNDLVVALEAAHSAMEKS